MTYRVDIALHSQQLDHVECAIAKHTTRLVPDAAEVVAAVIVRASLGHLEQVVCRREHSWDLGRGSATEFSS